TPRRKQSACALLEDSAAGSNARRLPTAFARGRSANCGEQRKRSGALARRGSGVECMMPWRKPVSSKGDESNALNRVLVIQLGTVAEFATALAAAKRIRDAHIGARITLLTTETTRELAEKCPYFDTVEADGRPKEPQAITKLIARVRAAKYDM